MAFLMIKLILYLWSKLDLINQIK